MAALTKANLDDIIENASKRIAGINTALTTIKADITAQQARVEAINDDSGIAAAVYAALQKVYDGTDDIFSNLANDSRIVPEVSILPSLFADNMTSPLDGDGEQQTSFDDWWTEESDGGNRLLSNEFAVAYRLAHGNASLAAKNCCAKTATSYGTTSVSGAGTCTNTLTATPVDTDLYTGGPLEAYVTTELSGAITFTLTGTDINGSTWTGSCAVGASDIHVGDVTSVTPTIASTYPKKLTNVTANAGSSGAVTWRIVQPYTYTQ